MTEPLPTPGRPKRPCREGNDGSRPPDLASVWFVFLGLSKAVSGLLCLLWMCAACGSYIIGDMYVATYIYGHFEVKVNWNCEDIRNIEVSAIFFLT